jgi:hypothetical protein
MAPPLYNAVPDGIPGLMMIPPPPAPGSNPPCSTLFVANLGPTCTEEELTQALSRLIFSNLMLQNDVFLNGC